MTTQHATQTGIPGLAEQQQVEVVLNAHAMRPYLQAHEESRTRRRTEREQLDGHLNARHTYWTPSTNPAHAVRSSTRWASACSSANWSGPARPLRRPAMHLHAFEDDPALPGLRTVLDGEAMGGILGEVLPECTAGAARIVRCRVTPLRYRLGKRCTLRFDLRLREQQPAPSPRARSTASCTTAPPRPRLSVPRCRCSPPRPPWPRQG